MCTYYQSQTLSSLNVSSEPSTSSIDLLKPLDPSGSYRREATLTSTHKYSWTLARTALLVPVPRCFLQCAISDAAKEFLRSSSESMDIDVWCEDEGGCCAGLGALAGFGNVILGWSVHLLGRGVNLENLTS